jgi:tRNA(fMet)-specific endonuclease VapC
MEPALLDTDMLSEVLKRKDRHVLAKARQYLAEHERLAFSALTLYEIMRGLLATRATRQLDAFRSTTSTSDVFPVGIPVLIRAAGLWAEARAAGHPHDDADLIIPATVLEGRRVLVTGNTAHFAWIPGLTLEDWRQA